jgi:hypothetical protein
MIEAIESGYLMVAGTNGKRTKNGITGGHCYTILHVQKVKINNKDVILIKLRNPYGYADWIGDWSNSDRSHQWENNPHVKNLMSHSLNSKDGVFCMNEPDFLRYFTSLTISTLIQKGVSTPI